MFLTRRDRDGRWASCFFLVVPGTFFLGNGCLGKHPFLSGCLMFFLGGSEFWVCESVGLVFFGAEIRILIGLEDGDSEVELS